MTTVSPLDAFPAVPAQPGVRMAFSGVRTGNMSLTVGEHDPKARERLARSVGGRTADLVFMQQVHGGSVAVVGSADRGRGAQHFTGSIPGVDALVTFDPGVALVVLTADCVPVLLHDSERAVAAVHAGRGGVMAGVVEAAVRALTPASVQAISATIGPAIGGCCYEVEAELADRVGSRLPAARAVTTWGTPSLDLAAAVASQLHRIGVHDVRRVGGCTRCEERWFSHRRSPGTGRQAGIIVRWNSTSGVAA
jgi:purine-nucleoside/S-methyl-5'-thioadenosine phosphorylase / adenosine deaminase